MTRSARVNENRGMPARRRTDTTPVYLEVGKQRVFACSVEWPGWCRAAKTEELALEALAEYGPRYAEVAKRARIAFPNATEFDVVQRVTGDATTDFGAPSRPAAVDAEPLDAAAGKRLARLMSSAWAHFDEIAAGSPEELRKGPRGGGRDRDKMIDHVLGAESAYARKLGIKRPQPARGDATAIAELREAILAVVGVASDGQPPVERGWPVGYAARRIAWHALDHAWEMQDRAEP
jgi:hypothetical protein